MKDMLNKIILGDCLDVMKGMPDKCVDLVLTDPPYKAESHGGTNSALAKRAVKVRDSIEFMANDFDFYNVAKELIRISNNIVMFCSNAQISRTMAFFEQSGLKTTLCVWDKTNPAPLGFNKLVNNLEYIIIARGKKCYFNNDLPINKKFMSFRYPTTTGKEHPAEKPLMLICDLMNLFSKESDIIFDPFIGSGTTAVACIANNRQFIGIEKDPEYHRLACERVEREQQNLFNMDN